MNRITRFLAGLLALLPLLLLAPPAQAIQVLIKQATTATPIQFLLVDTATGLAGQTGLSGTVAVKVHYGATSAAGLGTVTEVDSVNFPGVYNYTPTATETGTLGILNVHVSCTGCLTQDYAAQIVAFNPNDSVALGLSSLPTVAPGTSGGLPTIGTGNGQFNMAGFNAVPMTAQQAAIVTALASVLPFGTYTGGAYPAASALAAWPANFASTVISAGGVVTSALTGTQQASLALAGTAQQTGVAVTLPVGTGTGQISLAGGQVTSSNAGAGLTAQQGALLTAIGGTLPVGAYNGTTAYTGGFGPGASGGLSTLVSGAVVLPVGGAIPAGYGGAGGGMTTTQSNQLASLFGLLDPGASGLGAGTPVSRLLGSGFGLLPNVTVGGYAAGQDPATIVMAATIDTGGGQTLNFKQATFLNYVAGSGAFGTPIRSTSAPWTITVPWLRLDGSTTAWSRVTTYTDNTFKIATGASVVRGTLP